MLFYCCYTFNLISNKSALLIAKKEKKKEMWEDLGEGRRPLPPTWASLISPADK